MNENFDLRRELRTLLANADVRRSVLTGLIREVTSGGGKGVFNLKAFELILKMLDDSPAPKGGELSDLSALTDEELRELLDRTEQEEEKNEN